MADRFRPVPPPADDEPRPLGRRLIWFAAIALLSLAAVVSLACGLRAALQAVSA